MPPKGSGKPRGKSVSKSQKAGLTLPVARLNKAMKQTSGMKRVGGSAPVYMTAVIEYIIAEVVEMAGNHTKKGKRKRITPEDISIGVRSDEELAKLCRDVAFYTGDKISNPSKMLEPKPRKHKKEVEAE